MRDWDALQNNISSLRGQYTAWHPAISDALRQQWVDHGTAVFQHLMALLGLKNSSDAEKEHRLRRYLALRWQLTQRTSVDYTLHSQFPANRACLFIAEAIAKPDESVAEILMPTVTRVVGVADATMRVKEASENNEGKFVPPRFLITVAADAIIALPELFEYTKEDTDRTFSDNPLFQLTSEDHKNICDVSPEVCDLFTKLATIHRIKNGEKMSMGYLLRYLQKKLLKSSRAQSGAELQAEFLECEAPILAVYQYWRQLQENHRATYRRISQYRSADNTEILENYLLAMFSSVSGVALTDDEMEIVKALKKNITFYCAEQMSNALEAIIANNPNLETIPLPGYEEHFDAVEILPSAEELKTLHDEVIGALDRRMPMCGCDGELAHRLPFFGAFAADLCEETCLIVPPFFGNSIVVHQINNLENVPLILWMLPRDTWPNFFTAFNRKITRLFPGMDNSMVLLLTWIQKIPPVDWEAFFQAMSSVGVLRTHFNEETIAWFFEHCPEARWKLLYKAMQPFFSDTLATGDGLILFFQTLKPSMHFEGIAALFSNEIKRCFTDAKAVKPESILINLFLSYEEAQWYMLAAALKFVFFEKITSLKQVIFMTGRIERLSERVHFLKHVMHYATALIVNPDSVFALLQILNKEEWPIALRLITANRLQVYIFDSVTVVAFLEKFSNLESRVICARALQQILFLHQRIDSGQLYTVLNRLPECSDALIMMYRHQLVRVLNELLITFKTLNQHGVEIPAKMKDHFCFLVGKTLPVILDRAYFFSCFPDISAENMTEAQRQLMLDFQCTADKYNSLARCRKKIELLVVFCRENPHAMVFHPGFTLEFFENFLQQWVLLMPRVRDQTTQVEARVISPAAIIPASTQRARVWPNPASRASTPTLFHGSPVSLRDSARAASSAFFSRTDNEVRRGSQRAVTPSAHTSFPVLRENNTGLPTNRQLARR